MGGDRLDFREEMLRQEGLCSAYAPYPVAEATRTLGAVARGQVTLATFSMWDPVPFFAEFALWMSQGVARQKKARALARDVVAGKVSIPTPHRPLNSD